MADKKDKARRTVAIGLVGSTLDAGLGPRRWEKWRPSVALCAQPELPIDRFELLFQPKFEALASQVTTDIEEISPRTEVRSHAIEIEDAWDLEEMYGALYDFARDTRFDAEREDYLLHITTGTHVAQICLFLLCESRHFPARLVQTSPPARGEESKHGTHRIVDLDLSKYDRIARRFSAERVEARTFLKSGIATRNAIFDRMIERIEVVAARSREPMLLMGPTGAGKSMLAKRVYELKRARQSLRGAFVEVNCATLRGEMAHSALFGHVKGAFTGAADKREGLLRRADQGLLFLDEIGELGLDEQAMLLRAIEDKTFLPLGSDREVKSEFQLICGTNRDLRARVAEGKFREDLLARIDLWTFRLPALRERREDIAPNLDYELDAVSTRLGTRISMSKEARARFLGFAESPRATWPGNFRDLDAAVMRMATLAEGGRIDVAIVDEEIARLEDAWTAVTTKSTPGESDRVEETLGPERASGIDRFDRVQLEEVLRVCARSRSLSEAGRVLFAESRKTRTTINDADRLRKYLARFELDWDALVKRSV
ncbi:RNA repair transcriptional activator RtcR [Sandaracinus amylolyticus]|uniref:RNA repair transcriptional activator RtcR n=1 Tax=Sandaracinus amylolyticus TaxID=927083 RepID=UPI001F2AC2BE|nr:RNA repair transcriptional activator RtcR [Sandaracinus amylolyticus]UJR84940.1 Hypothetical protein I5071_70190 [Sandaracinus amylolyticus]